jgi:hypothetical protein
MVRVFVNKLVVPSVADLPLQDVQMCLVKIKNCKCGNHSGVKTQPTVESKC